LNRSGSFGDKARMASVLLWRIGRNGVQHSWIRSAIVPRSIHFTPICIIESWPFASAPQWFTPPFPWRLNADVDIVEVRIVTIVTFFWQACLCPCRCNTFTNHFSGRDWAVDRLCRYVCPDEAKWPLRSIFNIVIRLNLIWVKFVHTGHLRAGWLTWLKKRPQIRNCKYVRANRKFTVG